MTLFKFSRILLIASLLFFVAENMYFGWNATPMSPAEEVCDKIVIWSFRVAMVFYFSPLWGLYEKAVKKMFSDESGR